MARIPNPEDWIQAQNRRGTSRTFVSWLLDTWFKKKTYVDNDNDNDKDNDNLFMKNKTKYTKNKYKNKQNSIKPLKCSKSFGQTS